MHWIVTTGVTNGWTEDHSKKLYRRTMEMEQMTAYLLTEIRTNQAKAGANLKEMTARQPRKDDGQVRCPSQMDDGKDGFPARENGGHG
jgi:hypothetical protein